MCAIKSDIPVVLLAAGEAKRLQPLSNQIIKPIVPIAGIPIINRIIQNFYDNGFNQFIIVISSEENSIKEIINGLELVNSKKITVEFVFQNVPNGMADAILKADDLLSSKYSNSDSFFVSSVDILFQHDMPSKMYDFYVSSKPDMILSLVYSSDKKMAIGHGNAEVKENGIISKIIEKPGIEKKISNYYSMPAYIFSKEFLDVLKDLQKSKHEKSERGEFEVQTGIDMMIKKGKKIVGIDILPDLNKKLKFDDIGKYHLTFIKDMLKMTFRFLNEGKLDFEGEYPTAIEPVVSDGKVILGDSVFLGPNVYIGKDCKIENLVEISNSILMGNNKIGKSTIIENSVIGPNVVIDANQKLTGVLIMEESKENNEITKISTNDK